MGGDRQHGDPTGLDAAQPGGALEGKNELETLCDDIRTCCHDGLRDALDTNVRAAWLCEISCRLDLFESDSQIVHGKSRKGDITQAKPLDTVAVDGIRILCLKFSKLTHNRHVEGQYAGQPGRLSGNEKPEVAPALRPDPAFGNDLGIRVRHHAGPVHGLEQPRLCRSRSEPGLIDPLVASAQAGLGCADPDHRHRPAGNP